MRKVLIILILLITSCSPAIPSFERNFMSLGMNKDQVVMTFGVPHNKYISDNIEVWEYYTDVSSNSTFNSFNFNSFSNINNTITTGHGRSYLHKTRFFFINGEVVGFKSE